MVKETQNTVTVPAPLRSSAHRQNFYLEGQVWTVKRLVKETISEPSSKSWWWTDYTLSYHLGTLSATYQARLVSLLFPLTTSCKIRTLNHCSTKFAWYATEVYQKGPIRYKKRSKKAHLTIAMSGQWPDIAGFQNSGQGFWLVNYDFE